MEQSMKTEKQSIVLDVSMAMGDVDRAIDKLATLRTQLAGEEVCKNPCETKQAPPAFASVWQRLPEQLRGYRERLETLTDELRTLISP